MRDRRGRWHARGAHARERGQGEGNAGILTKMKEISARALASLSKGAMGPKRERNSKRRRARNALRDVTARRYDARNHKGTIVHDADVSSACEPSSIHPEHTNGSKIRNKEKSLQSAGASCAVDTRIRTLQSPPRTSQPHHTYDMPRISRSAAPAVALRLWSPRIKMKGRKSDGRKAHRPPLYVLSITSFPPLSSPP